jgi:hypothetical protein
MLTCVCYSLVMCEVVLFEQYIHEIWQWRKNKKFIMTVAVFRKRELETAL